MKDHLKIPDQELDIEPHSVAYMAGVKVKIGKRSLAIVTAHGSTFTFRKRKMHGEEFLMVAVEKIESIKTDKQCNLGHLHVHHEKAPVKFDWMSISKGQTEQLMHWIENGEWIK